MTTDITLPASLLAEQPRGRRCARCGGSLYRDEDGDWRCFSCCRLYEPPEHVEPEDQNPHARLPGQPVVPKNRREYWAEMQRRSRARRKGISEREAIHH